MKSMKPIAFLSIALLLPCLLAKEPIPTPATDSIVGPIEPYLFKKILNGRDLDGSISQHWKDPALQGILKQHEIELFGGPMLGDVTSTSVKFWLRATRPSKVTVKVIEVSKKKPK